MLQEMMSYHGDMSRAANVIHKEENYMKFGMRKPSLKKSFKARTTGKAKRKMKKALIPGYGKKGRGVLHPKRAVKNKIYKKTTFSIFDLFK